MPCSLHQEP
ncbi:hypothetical protein LINPERPRIM_LOCUS5476 [Linum perenne]